MTTDAASLELRTPDWGRLLFVVNMVVAWCGVLLSLTLNLSGYYVASADPSEPTILGNIPSGIEHWWERLFDWLTFFTILSNIVVAVVLTVLVTRPALFVRRDTVGEVWRTLRVDSVIMIVITGVLYNLLLASGGLTGWGFLSNLLLHVLTPIITFLVWLLAGPWGLVRVRTVFQALLLPLLWAVWALARGAVVGAYPYWFLDVQQYGLGTVVGVVGAVTVLGVLLGLGMVGVDALVRRRARRTAASRS